jgi:hypothetical protein
MTTVAGNDTRRQRKPRGGEVPTLDLSGLMPRAPALPKVG